MISARLSDTVRVEDVVCLDQGELPAEARLSRLVGDEFTVLLSGIHGPADVALYCAKDAGCGFRFFAQSMEDGVVRRLSLEHELRGAIDRDEICLHYQPRIDFRTQEVVGAEALVRWSSPTLGRVSPEEILRVAEDSGFISDLGRWIIRSACQEAAYWASARDQPCRLSVNVSPLQFEQDDVFSVVVDALKRAGLPPELLDR